MTDVTGADFTDLDEFLTPELQLPIAGRTYAVSPSADLVLRMRRWYGSTEATSDDLIAMQAEALGATYDPDTTEITGSDGSTWAQLESDGVSGERILRLLTTVSLWFGFSHDAALHYWQHGNLTSPKAPEKTPSPNRATRRAANKKAGAKGRGAGMIPAPEPSE
ncbi:DUF7426 family protein [Gordonia sp. NPDC003376]